MFQVVVIDNAGDDDSQPHSYFHSFIHSASLALIHLLIQCSIHSSVNVTAYTFVMQLPTSPCIPLFVHTFI